MTHSGAATSSKHRGERPRALLYLRQSKEREDSISFENQEYQGRAYCERMGYEVIGVRSDPDMSGRIWHKRPGVQDALRMSDNGEFDVVVLWKWSRLCRRRDWPVAVDAFESKGTRLESSTETIDTSTASGRFGRGVLMEMAVFESERIGETWREAHERRVRDGVPHHGKPRFGYIYDREAKMHRVDPETGPILAELYRRYNSGQAFYSLVKWLNENGIPTAKQAQDQQNADWRTATLRRCLDSGFGAGYFTYRDEMHKGKHEAVISEDEWIEYQRRRAARATYKRGERPRLPLIGHVYCWCGERMVSHGAKASYRCAAVHKGKPHEGGQVIRASFVHDAVKAWLAGVADELNREAAAAEVRPKTSSVDAERQRLARQQIKLENRLESLAEKYADDDIDVKTYRRTREKAQTELQSIQERLDGLIVEERNPVSEIAPDLLRDWDSMPVELKRDLLTRLMHPVVVEYTEARRHSRPVTVRGRWEAPREIDYAADQNHHRNRGV